MASVAPIPPPHPGMPAYLTRKGLITASSELTAHQFAALPPGCTQLVSPLNHCSTSGNGLLLPLEAIYGPLCDISMSGTLVQLMLEGARMGRKSCFTHTYILNIC